MASLDMSAPSAFPAVGNTTLSGTPGNVRKVLLPARFDGTVSLRPRTNDAKFGDASLGLAEDAPLASSPYATLDHDVWTEVAYHALGGSTFFYLASGTASVVVEVMLERARRVI